ncbi:unnamed protein product [Blepharisma stoltei]|uniref:Uncharacterized protein n=1 Tax=Blepharisma stoltei TaxID=1481888 RepID=A0AAU9JP93_9CILI|nr:unnamed protein product [Blepharisma stoltei]
MGCAHHKMKIQIIQSVSFQEPPKRVPTTISKLILTKEKKESLFTISEASANLEDTRRLSKLFSNGTVKRALADSRRMSLLSSDGTLNQTFKSEVDC